MGGWGVGRGISNQHPWRTKTGVPFWTLLSFLSFLLQKRASISAQRHDIGSFSPNVTDSSNRASFLILWGVRIHVKKTQQNDPALAGAFLPHSCQSPLLSHGRFFFPFFSFTMVFIKYACPHLFYWFLTLRFQTRFDMFTCTLSNINWVPINTAWTCRINSSPFWTLKCFARDNCPDFLFSSLSDKSSRILITTGTKKKEILQVFGEWVNSSGFAIPLWHCATFCWHIVFLRHRPQKEFTMNARRQAYENACNLISIIYQCFPDLDKNLSDFRGVACTF